MALRPPSPSSLAPPLDPGQPFARRGERQSLVVATQRIELRLGAPPELRRLCAEPPNRRRPSSDSPGEPQAAALRS